MDSNDASTGVCPAPPPPPPPPVPGQVPALRISTIENSRPKPPANDVYEPPAAIQNAMLTKDKKPFTYTPGMGGKLDLSQIRSPRMARRVAKNANDEGIEGPPKSALEAKPPPTSTGANIYIQPQVAVPVFPVNMPVPNKTAVNNVSRIPAAPFPEKQIVEPTKTVVRIEPKPSTPLPPSSPETPTSPTQVTLAKAPTPWMKRNKSQEEDLPEWARRPNKSQESTPEKAASPPVYVVQQSSPPPPPQRSQIPQNFANQRTQQQRQTNNDHVIPLRIEDRPSVFSAINEPGHHHQFKQSSPQHQQRWGQQNSPPSQVPVQVQIQSSPQNRVQIHPQNQVQYQPQYQDQVHSPRPKSQNLQSGGTYIVPMVIEGKEPPKPTGTLLVQSSIPSQTRIIPIQPPSPQINPQRNSFQQAEPGPIQSKSFRVLQKITSTDTPDEVDGDHLRKLQLTEDDRMLMNKFKEQVDNDNYLHQEEDPRYRGAAIPSRAFRYLQNMTDAGEITSNTLPRANNAINKKQNRNSKTFDERQMNLPPSEQQVAEPKKYSGSAIPSRSFKLLQAMTDPQSIAIQQYHQADFIYQSENSMGNQQSLFFSPYVPNYCYPKQNFWPYCPVPPYSLAPDYNSFSYYNCGHYSYYPMYNAYYMNPIINQQMPQYSDSEQQNTEETEQTLRRNSTLLFSPKKTNMTTLTDDTKLSTESRLIISSNDSDSDDSDIEFSKIDSSSTDSDSESYLVYSTGLNRMENGDDSRIKDNSSSHSVTTISEDTYEKYFVEKQNSLDYFESDDESQKEDYESNINSEATVSVSLPLRFKFSVSENNEDVTTVIVGDSTIKSENSSDVNTNVLISTNNSVDFTLKRKSKQESVQESDNNLHAEFTIKVTKSVREVEDNVNEKRKIVVQNFETDDEDSGVTSDVSRIISEVDSDSECSVRRQNTFQRTQTHSRLFKLLTEDSTEDRRKNRFSLPADFNDYYTSNDLSWKRLHESDEKEIEDNCEKSRNVTKDDVDVVPSLAYQVLDNKRPTWTYRFRPSLGITVADSLRSVSAEQPVSSDELYGFSLASQDWATMPGRG